MSNLWFVVSWLDDGGVESSECRGPFTTERHRREVMGEVVEESDRDIVIIPLSIEGDDDATLEVDE